AHAPLIHCSDGNLHAATEIYDPRQAEISAILGEGAAFPLRSTYEQGEAHWLTFFAELGMSATPRAEDLIKTIDNLIDDARSECSTTIKQRLQRLFSYLDEHWETWHNATIHNPPEGGKSTSLIEALSRRAWLPAIQSGERYPGFIAPPDRLYRPAEIYPPALGNLVASQQPVAALCAPSDAIIEALQFATKATIDTVSRHFDQLLELANQKQDSGGSSATENIEKALTTVYQYFGAIQDDETLDKLKARYQDKPCIWHPVQQQLWVPKHTFKTPVAFFEPRRTDLRAEDPDHDRGIAALGRRKAPSIEDYIEFLQESQNTHGNEPLCDSESRQVLQVLHHLGTDLIQQHRSVALNRLVVLSAANRLVSAAAGYIADAPWYESRFSSEQVHLLHSETEYNLIKAANLKRLSQHVIEKLIDRPTPSENAVLSQLCEKWQDTIRSLEFRAGLIRLIRHRHGFDQCYELNWLPELSVVAVQSIHAEFWMSDPIEQRQILVGVGESEYYLDSDARVIYMRGQATDLMSNFLARAINQRLGAQQLEDLAPLVVILNTPRQYTQDVLTQFRISRYENEVMDVNFPENAETDSSFEEDLIKESNNLNRPDVD
ncbi:MAG: hypothetical protein GXP10_03345, partial [Gammaproteobacteria bacterium]|nr:hypothetical protein [Gammaproteobacteria bacterium]